jgi:hypothetical protein
MSAIGYIQSIKVLIVRFKNGSVYEYDLPISVFEEMKAEDSKGRFFNRRIRDKFPFRRLALN